jgi:hypothetical protein
MLSNFLENVITSYNAVSCVPPFTLATVMKYLYSNHSFKDNMLNLKHRNILKLKSFLTFIANTKLIL